MKRVLKLLPLIFLFMSIAGCNSNKKMPFLAIEYGNHQVIELYYSPRTAVVDGQSGSWEETDVADERYMVSYGNRKCVLSTTKKMIYFGDIMDAIYDLKEESKWIPYREKR